MRKLGFVLILAGFSLLAGSVALHLGVGAAAPMPAAVLELERALARPGLLALVTLDVERLVDLAEPGDSVSDDGAAAWLAQAGIDFEQDVTHATLALTAHADGKPRVALAVFGSFEPSELERALQEHPQLEVAPKGDVLWLKRVDPESCEESGPWAVQLLPQRVLVAHADSIAPLLAAQPAEGALRDLDRFQSFRDGQLVSAAFFVPEELPETDNMLVAMATQGAARQIEGFRAFYAGAAPGLLPPGLAVDALFEGVDADVTAQKAAQWQSALDGLGEGLGAKLPILAQLLGTLEIRAQGRDLHAGLRLAKSDLDQLGDLPGEIGAGLFGVTMQLDGGEPPSEQIDESPLAFLAQTSEGTLAPYDPSASFAGAADHTAGPFGVRLSAIRLRPDDGRSELEVEAFATGIPNLGDRDERVTIEVTSVESTGGQELLAEERCGADRNDAPAALSTNFGGEVLTGKKTVRIRDGATPEWVARIAGRTTLHLPTRTESVRLPAQPGETLERAGARFEITRAEAGSFSYRISGEPRSLLHLRALNADGKPLQSQSSSSSTALFGKGGSGSMQYAGVVHEVEAVFALEEQALHFPFQVTGARPGSDGQHLAPTGSSQGDPPPKIRGALEDWLEKIAGDVAKQVEAVVDGRPEPIAVTRSGPFQVSLESIWSFGGLMPRIEVQTPEIPGVAGSPTAVELRLDELRMQDGSVHAGDWSRILEMGQGFGKPGLVGSAQVRTGVPGSGDDVASLHGSVSVRLPKRVASRSFRATELGAGLEVPGLSVKLVELARDRLILRADTGAERVLGARAFNAAGEELWIPHTGIEQAEDGAVSLQLEVKGVPEKLELRYAEKLLRAEYGFALAKDGATLAKRSR